MKAVFAILAIVAIFSGVGAQARSLSGTQTFTSGGKCVAVADASVWKSAQDGCAVAFASAGVNTCSATNYNVDDLVSHWYDAMCAVADAIAKVRVSAFAKCYSTGFTFGCAAAKGYADAKSSAIIALFSAAYAKAVNDCPSCDPVSTDAVAGMFSALVVQIDAQVAATAKAAICIGPNGYAEADAYLKCTSAIYAKGLAEACAKAWISGGCTDMTADIQANAIAEVNNMITVNKYCSCKGYTYVTGVGYKPVKWTGDELDKYYSDFDSCPKYKVLLKAQCYPDATQIV